MKTYVRQVFEVETCYSFIAASFFQSIEWNSFKVLLCNSGIYNDCACYIGGYQVFVKGKWYVFWLRQKKIELSSCASLPVWADAFTYFE